MGANNSRPTASLPQPHLILHPNKRKDITQCNINTLFKSNKFRDVVAKRLSGAVKIPTATYDDMMMVGEDPRWDVFYDMTKYLSDAFPEM
jgi:Gly-Xaa carboxypeptidase